MSSMDVRVRSNVNMVLRAKTYTRRSVSKGSRNLSRRCPKGT